MFITQSFLMNGNGHRYPAALLRETSEMVVYGKLESIKYHQRSSEYQKAAAQIEATVAAFDLPDASGASSGVWDQIGVLLCRLLHKNPVYNQHFPYSQCPNCRRKYALPWAQSHEIDPDVYRYHSKPLKLRNASEEYIQLWGRCKSNECKPSKPGHEAFARNCR